MIIVNIKFYLIKNSLWICEKVESHYQIRWAKLGRTKFFNEII